ncbi:hypothetical protein FXO38_24588 [Capsicum annuum]|uniref:G-patch domain-containing protein n=1 Tax=Capsicum annuum TaxID=4072 RepID=A0A2G3AAW0_CAPAN|nr:hypothetical protein FXO38_24588 [Capsicum annuum]PHT91313.1 hypothetical protein T459_06426 [Capsicum annuum]
MPAEAEMSNTKKMVASEMLKYGYQPKTGLGPRADDIVEPIQLKQQKGTTRLGYDPISGVTFSKGFRMTIFVPAQVLVSEQTDDEDITEGIGNLFVAMIEEKSEIAFKKLTIRDADPGEALQNWTTNSSLFCQESCTNDNKNPHSTIMMCNEFVEKNTSDEQDYEEYDESMMPENLPHEIEKLKS